MYNRKINYLLILLFSVNIFAIENKQFDNTELSPNIIVNSKTKIKNGIGKSIVYLNPRVVWKDSLYRREYNLHFISNITASIGNEKILDASFSYYFDVWHSPFISFKFKNVVSNDDEIVYRVTDNHGKNVQKSFKIIKTNNNVKRKNKQKSTLVSTAIINSKAWEETTINSAIKAVYGPNALKETNKQGFVSFCEEDRCIHDSITPIKILLELKENIESIAIFSTATDKSLLAVFKNPSSNVISISMLMRLEREGDLLAVAKTKDGRLYKSTSSIINKVRRIEDGEYSLIKFRFKE